MWKVNRVCVCGYAVSFFLCFLRWCIAFRRTTPPPFPHPGCLPYYTVLRMCFFLPSLLASCPSLLTPLLYLPKLCGITHITALSTSSKLKSIIFTAKLSAMMGNILSNFVIPVYWITLPSPSAASYRHHAPCLACFIHPSASKKRQIGDLHMLFSASSTL